MNAFFVCLILYFAVSPTWGQLDEQTIQNFDWNKDSAEKNFAHPKLLVLARRELHVAR